MNMLSRTPPTFSVGSLDPLMKRARSGSISKRLRNAAEMAEENQLDKEDQGALKEIILRDDPRLQKVMQRIEAGDREVLKEMLADGTLASARKNSIDLMGDFGDLNFDFLNVAEEDDGGAKDGFMDTEDQFEFTFDDNLGGMSMPSSIGHGDPHDLGMSPNLGLDASRGPKSNPRNIKPSARRRDPRDDAAMDHGIRPLPVRANRAGSFTQAIPELFDFNLFDDMPGPNMSYSPMSPSRSMGSTGTHRPLHRDSIAHLDDLLLPQPGSFTSAAGSFEQESMNPMKRDSSLSKASLSSSSQAASKPKRSNSSKPPKPPKAPTAKTTAKQTSTPAPTSTASMRTAAKPRPIPSGVKPAAVKAENEYVSAPPQVVQALDMSSTNMQTGYIGGYSPDSRRRRIEKFLQKRQNRIWMKRVKYDVRKNFADSRLRVKGRFVKKEDEEVLRELIVMTL